MFEAETANTARDLLELNDSLLEDRLQEDDNDAHLAILVHRLRACGTVTALLHAVLDEQKSELCWEVYMALHAVENLKQSNR